VQVAVQLNPHIRHYPLADDVQGIPLEKHWGRLPEKDRDQDRRQIRQQCLVALMHNGLRQLHDDQRKTGLDRAYPRKCQQRTRHVATIRLQIVQQATPVNNAHRDGTCQAS
jgi:hypothetical protein